MQEKETSLVRAKSIEDYLFLFITIKQIFLIQFIIN